MRTALVLSLSLAFSGGAALAEANTPVPQHRTPLSLAQAQAGTPVATAAKRRGHGRAGHRLVAEKQPAEKQPGTARSPSSIPDALTSCLAMWEAATHMTKSEWARACQRVAERLKDTTLK